MAQRDEWNTGIDEDILRNLIELRSFLESRLKELEDEVEKMRTLFKILDEVIVSKSFRGAETLTPPQTITPQIAPPIAVPESVDSIPLQTSYGILLADVYMDSQNLRIVPAEPLAFTVNTPPFQSFFISRILEPMKVKDDERVRKGEILPEMALSYEVVTDQETLREVVVTNYGGEQRAREIRSSCRWTLEKMYERTTRS